jgi:hypothetical protein
MIGVQPAQLQGGLPRPMIVPAIRPTYSWYCCPKWEEMAADHPDLAKPAIAPTHEGTEARQ